MPHHFTVTRPGLNGVNVNRKDTVNSSVAFGMIEDAKQAVYACEGGVEWWFCVDRDECPFVVQFPAEGEEPDYD